MKTFFLSLVLGAALFAQTKPAEAPKPPVIPIEDQAEYFRADGALAHMKPAYDAASADLQAAAAKVIKACGEKYQPNQDGKVLVCQPKPEAPKADAKK